MEKLRSCALFVLDMDGTLYLGDEVLEGAHTFVRRLMKLGKKVVYLTNNSSRAGIDYVDRLRLLGFPCERENVYTSGMATAAYLLRQHPGRPVYAVGTEAFRRELLAYGVPLGYEEDAAVAVGFDRELTYEKLEKAVRLLRRGAPFIASNPDLVCPMPAGEVLPDCGSICALLAAATGRSPLYIGKPHRRMLDILSQNTGVPHDKICCVGDRLYTDIAAAKNAGALSVLVLSGETTSETLRDSKIKPDYVFKDVAELGNSL